MCAFYKVIRIVCSERAEKRKFITEELQGPGRESSCAFHGPEAFVPSLLDSLTVPSCQLHIVQDTGSNVQAGHHGASKAWGLRIMRSRT